MSGVITFQGQQLNAKFIKVQTVNAETRGHMPQGERTQVFVEAIIPADHADGLNGGITPQQRTKLLECALSPTESNQGPLVVQFHGDGGRTVMATYQFGWSWISSFIEENPQDETPGDYADAGIFNQTVKVRWRLIPRDGEFEAAV